MTNYHRLCKIITNDDSATKVINLDIAKSRGRGFHSIYMKYTQHTNLIEGKH